MNPVTPSAPPAPVYEERQAAPRTQQFRPDQEVQLPVLEVQPWVRRLQRALAEATYGVVRVDLTRPTWRRVPGAARPGRGLAPPPRGAPGYVESERHWEYTEPTLSSLIQGSRLKAMRYAGIGPIVPSGRRAVDLGVGLDLDMERGNLRPAMRLRVWDVARFKLFPTPLFKLKHDFPIPGTGLVARVTFHQPLTSADISQLGKSGAWNVSFGRRMERTAVHFSPDRIEVSGQTLTLGDNVRLWFSGDIAYPRNLPASDWQEQIKISPTRIGLKVGW